MPVIGINKAKGFAQPIWYGDHDNPQPFTVQNNSATGGPNVWIGTDQSTGPSDPNRSTPLAPGGFLSYDGTEQVYYANADGVNAQIITYPGVVSVFQPGQVSTSGTGPTLDEDASTPAVVSVNATNPTATTASFSPPAQSLLVAVYEIGFFSATGAPSVSISDSGGHAWTIRVSKFDGSLSYVAIATAPIGTATGSITVTVTVTSTTVDSGLSLAVRVLNNAAASQAGAGTGSNSGSSTTVGSTVTTTQLNSTVYVGTSFQGTIASTPITGTTTINIDQDTTASATQSCGRALSLTTSLGATTFGWTITAAEAFASCCLEILHA